MRWYTGCVGVDRPLLIADVERLMQIPGVWIGGGQEVRATGDAVKVVQDMLQAAGYQTVVSHLGGPPGSVTPPESFPWLTPEARASTLPHQWEGVAHLERLRGGVLGWDCGTGKTRAGVMWACRDSARTIVVTRAPTVAQWLTTFRRLTTMPMEHIHVVQGLEGYKAQRSPPRGQDRWVWRAGEIRPEEIVKQLQAAGIRPSNMQAAVDLLDEIPEGSASAGGLPVSEVVKPSPATYTRLVEAGLLVEGVREEAEWKPWRVVTQDRVRRVMSQWTGEEPVRVPDAVTMAAWREAANSPDMPAAGRLPYQLLLARVDGWSIDALAHRAQTLPEPLSRAEILDVLAQHLATLDVEARRAELHCDPQARIILVGWPVLAARVEALRAWGPERLIYDESQYAKSHRIWDRVEMPDGRARYTFKDTMAGAAANLSRASTVREVGILSATLLLDRPRDLWSQLAMVDPRAAGQRYKLFALRYAAAFDGKYSLDDTGASNEQELAARLARITHHVPISRALAHLPPLVLEIVHIPEKDLRFPPTSAGALKRVKAGGGPLAVLHYELLLAAEAKSHWVVESVLQNLADGEQCVVLTGRREHAVRLGEMLGHRTNHPVYVATGEDGDMGSRQALVQTFRGTPLGSAGPGVLIGTLQAWGDAIDGLQGVPRAYICMLPWNLMLVQLLGRFRRLGGGDTATQVMILIAEGTKDLRMVEVVLPKLRAAATITQSEVADALATQFDASHADRDTDLIQELFDALCASATPDGAEG